jgi:hypothetical protein
MKIGKLLWNTYVSARHYPLCIGIVISIISENMKGHLKTYSWPSLFKHFNERTFDDNFWGVHLLRRGTLAIPVVDWPIYIVNIHSSLLKDSAVCMYLHLRTGTKSHENELPNTNSVLIHLPHNIRYDMGQPTAPLRTEHECH